MLAAFCLIVLFIFCGLILGLIKTTRAKSAEKKVRLIDGRGIIGKKEFAKMVNKEAKKKNKKYLILLSAFFANSFFCNTEKNSILYV